VGDFKIAYDEIWRLDVKDYEEDEDKPVDRVVEEQGKKHKFDPEIANLLGRVELWEVANKKEA
jgi:hypothetical protein